MALNISPANNQLAAMNGSMGLRIIIHRQRTIPTFLYSLAPLSCDPNVSTAEDIPVSVSGFIFQYV